ncbi:succinylglutamic semialdehyde dehydrogenase, partial [Yersinia pestis PY-88]
MSQQRLWQGR